LGQPSPEGLAQAEGEENPEICYRDWVASPIKILVVEDELKIARAIKEGLERESHEVTLAHSGEEAFFVLNSGGLNLVLLDIMLPGRSGIEILKAIRKSGLEVPVLILTARDSVENRVEGLDAGADDYLVKPFAFPELLARIRSLLRRSRAENVHRFQLADLEVGVAQELVENRQLSGSGFITQPPSSCQPLSTSKGSKAAA